MPKVKALHSIGVARLLGSYAIPHVNSVIPNGTVLELSEEIINLIGADSFEIVTNEETKMSDETKPVDAPVETTETTTPEVTAPVEETLPTTEPTAPVDAPVA